jgi:hypothetical protein
MYAHITTDSNFCYAVAEPVITYLPQEKSNKISVEPENNTISDGVEQLKAYPNLNNGKFTIEYLNINSGSEIKIYNTLGAIIYRTVAKEDGSQNIDLSGIRNGLYFIIVIDGREHFSRKIIVE